MYRCAGMQVSKSIGVQVYCCVRLFLWSDIDGFDQILVQENEVEVDAGGTAAGAGCCVFLSDVDRCRRKLYCSEKSSEDGS